MVSKSIFIWKLLYLARSLTFLLHVNNGSNNTESEFIPFWKLLYSDEFFSAVEQAFIACPNLKMCGNLIEKELIEDHDFQMRYVQLVNKYLNSTSSVESAHDKTEEAVNNACCTPCSCSEECVLLRNCCPDFGRQRYNETSFFNDYFNRPSCSSSLHRHIKYNPAATPFNTFMRFNGCPYTGFSENSTGFGYCIIPPMTFDGTVMVYSAETNMLYSNKFCAECNEASDLESFRLAATGCPINLYTLNISEDSLQKYVIERCVLVSEFPSTIATTSFRCSSPGTENYIDGKCNVTGLWEEYNSVVNLLCESRQGLNTVYDGIYSYTNPFCYICNTPKRYLANTVCKNRPANITPLSLDLGPVYDLQLRFPELIASWSNRENWTTCQNGTFFDPAQNICERFFCPHSSQPGANGCYSRLFNAREKVYELFVLTEFLNDPQMSSILHIFTENAYSVTLELLKHINFNKLCTIDFSAKLVMKNVKGAAQYVGFLVLIEVLSDDVCDDAALAKIRVPYTQFEYRRGQNRIIMNASLYDGPVSLVPGMSMFNFVNLTHLKQDPLTKVNVPAPVLNCPYVVLSDLCALLSFRHIHSCYPLDLNLLPQTFVRVRSLTSERYYICVEDYLNFVRGQEERRFKLSCSSIEYCNCLSFVFCLVSLLSLPYLL